MPGHGVPGGGSGVERLAGSTHHLLCVREGEGGRGGAALGARGTERDARGGRARHGKGAAVAAYQIPAQAAGRPPIGGPRCPRGGPRARSASCARGHRPLTLPAAVPLSPVVAMPTPAGGETTRGHP
eukprot:scaffold48_cov395-Prasinococcus_capsulatus_cf.AAC.2